ELAPMTTSPLPLTLAVPAYFHPAEWPRKWKRLVAAASLTRFVIVNPHSGPGEELDVTYMAVIEALRAARVRMLGYVDPAYGSREPADIAREMGIYRSRYGLDGVFMDQVSTSLEELDHYAQCVVA